jgi:hypothetical protein
VFHVSGGVRIVYDEIPRAQVPNTILRHSSLLKVEASTTAVPGTEQGADGLSDLGLTGFYNREENALVKCDPSLL